MSFRTVVITNRCKCSYKNNYLIVRSEDVKMIHLSEINTVVFDCLSVSVSAYLINELVANKINVIMCDGQHNPAAQIMPLYGNYCTSKRINEQLAWSEDTKGLVWTFIVKEKIHKQAQNLLAFGFQKEADMLMTYADEVELADKTNREGHAAKVYFNALFGLDFSRREDNDINAALNYGYALILSLFNKEIVSAGYLTQLGVFHRGEQNPFNLSCDFMEPLRPYIDSIVYKMVPFIFDKNTRLGLYTIFDEVFTVNTSSNHIVSAISIYAKSLFKALNEDDVSVIRYIEYGDKHEE